MKGSMAMFVAGLVAGTAATKKNVLFLICDDLRPQLKEVINPRSALSISSTGHISPFHLPAAHAVHAGSSVPTAEVYLPAGHFVCAVPLHSVSSLLITNTFGVNLHRHTQN